MDAWSSSGMTQLSKSLGMELVETQYFEEDSTGNGY